MRARNQSGDLSPMMLLCLAGYFGGEIYARAFSRRYPDSLNHRNTLGLQLSRFYASGKAARKEARLREGWRRLN